MRAGALIMAMSLAGPVAASAQTSSGNDSSPQASLTLSRHYTTNALDTPLQLDDWYTQLRGSVASKLAHDLGTTGVTANINAKHYDVLSIENDFALGISTDTTVALSENFELRGTLAVQMAEEGDELLLGEDAFLGIRTRKTVMTAGLQAGLRLDADTVLAMEATASREKPEDTQFENDILPPLRLDPDRDRFRAGTKLTRTHGPVSFGAYGTAGLMRSGTIGFLPPLEVMDYAVGAHAGIRFANGAVAAGSVGLHALELFDADFRQQRLAYELAAEMPVFSRFSLRGSLKAAFDPKTNDDPVATWARRMELEAGYRHSQELRFGTGLYLERRENLGLETVELARGLYAEAEWQINTHLGLTMRVDATRKLLENFGLQRDTVDVHMALAAKL